MSRISDIQNELNTIIETQLPAYVKLPDSVDSPDNAMIHLDKGYSTGFGSGQNAQDNFCKGTIRVQLSMVFVLSNSYTASLDGDQRNTLEQSLMDDHTTILKELECNPTLNGQCIVTEYESDTGIEYLLGNDRKQFIIITSTVSVDYEEGV